MINNVLHYKGKGNKFVVFFLSNENYIVLFIVPVFKASVLSSAFCIRVLANLKLRLHRIWAQTWQPNQIPCFHIGFKHIYLTFWDIFREKS